MSWSQFARNLRCRYCGEVNQAEEWPIKGDIAPFTYQKEPGIYGVYNVKVHCPHCNKDWYVVWDKYPGSVVRFQNGRIRKPVDLHSAASIGDAEVARVLLAHGANVNAQDPYGFTPRHHATEKGHAEMVELLLAGGAQVNAQTQKGNTALQLAELKGHARVVELLYRREERR